MKAEASTAGANVSQTLTKGACPICGILTGFSVKVKEFVPLRLRTLVDEIVERNRAELEQELETFLEQLKHGIHEGGGLLGRAAEFLVGQRGL